MYGKFQQHLQTELAAIREAGLYKNERLICGPQQAEINVGGKTVLNFCANNYLGLSNHPRLISAAKAAMDTRGYGMSKEHAGRAAQRLAEAIGARVVSIAPLSAEWDKQLLLIARALAQPSPAHDSTSHPTH